MAEIDSQVDAFETYFGEEVSYDDLCTMTEEEREAYFLQLLLENPLSEDEIKAFEDELQAEIDDYYALYREQYAQLEAIIDNDASTAAEIQTAQDSLALLDEIEPGLSGDISSDWGDAVDLYEEMNVVLEAGEDYTSSIDNPINEATYTIDASATDTSSGSAFNTAANEDWLDLDHDGYKETNPDVNNDGIADDDYNGDSVITEADLTYGTETDRTTVTLDLDSTDTLEMASYDADTQTVVFKVTKEDGTVYYIEVIGDCDIISSVIPTNLSSMHDDVTARMRESGSSEHTYYYFNNGVEPNAATDFYTIVDMNDMPDNSYTVDPSTDDWTNERDYTIDMNSSKADELNLEFDDDVELDFAAGPNGELIITATNSLGQTITITVENWSVAQDSDGNTDQINITGGIIDDDDLADLYDISTGLTTKGTATYGFTLAANIIYYDSDESLETDVISAHVANA